MPKKYPLNSLAAWVVAILARRLYQLIMHKEDVTLSDGKFRQLLHFSGITEFVETARDGLADGKTWKRKGIEHHGAAWHHGTLASVKKSTECLLYAKPAAHVVAKAEAFKEALMASDAYRHASEKAQSTKRRRVFELDGAELDIDRYLGQQDECWGRVTRGLQRPVIRLAVSGTASSDNDESAFAGTAALATCCALLAEQAGCSLEILGTVVIASITPGTEEGGSIMPIKHADEPFHQDALLSFGIPAVLRYFGFAIDHNLLVGEINYGHGVVLPMSQVLRDHLNVQHVLEVAWYKGKQMAFLDDFVKTLHDA